MLVVCLDVLQTDPATGKVPLRSPKSVTDGLTPRPAPLKPGLHLLTPAQVAGLAINAIRIDHHVEGYQRELKVAHARKIARKLADGHPMPPILYALDEGDVTAEIIDGQHRAAAAIIARQPIWGVCFEATPEERAKLFASQGAARKIDNVTLILSGDQPWHRYMQDVLINTEHAWADIASQYGSASTIRIDQAYALMIRFVCGVNHPGSLDEQLSHRWNHVRANLLPQLLVACGQKRSNPHAWTAIALRSLVATATLVVDDFATVERWKAHMPAFDFAGHRHIRSTREFSERLVEHWNRGLKRSDQVAREAA